MNFCKDNISTNRYSAYNLKKLSLGKTTMMRLIFRISKLLYIVLILNACSKRIYIVRHAEKDIVPNGNPNLTQAGQERALLLKKMLKHKQVSLVYSTNTNRTIQTAQPIATASNAAINYYSINTIHAVLKTIFLSKKNALIVGHSNSVLQILDSLHVKHRVTKIEEDVFGHFFIVKIKGYNSKNKNPYKVCLQEKKYGKSN